MDGRNIIIAWAVRSILKNPSEETLQRSVDILPTPKGGGF